MKTVRVRLGERKYSILIGRGLLARSGHLIASLVKSKSRVAIVTDRNVAKLYLKPIKQALSRKGFNVKAVILPTGESIKSLPYLTRLHQQFLSHKMERSSLVIALGGGVIGDLVGFAAATFMRGIDFVQIPTSLLAQVDSSVGGKVAINMPQGKNLIGAFYQPRLVIIDPTVLKTLPRAEFTNGMAEVIKAAVIKSPTLFRFLKLHRDRIMNLNPKHLEEMIYQAVSIKAKVVEKDEREQGLRVILNYGHTIGHALEASGQYRAHKHGQTVALGMTCAALIARQLKLIKEPFLIEQAQLLTAYGLPTRPERKLRTTQVLNRLRFDKKVLKGKIRFVLPRKVGQVIISDKVTPQMIRKVLETIPHGAGPRCRSAD